MVEGGAVVCPGDRLFPESDCEAGSGIYKRAGFLYASLLGVVQITKPEGQPPDNQKNDRVDVVNQHAPGRVVPKVGDMVIGRVTRLMQRSVVVDILCIGTQGLRTTFNGLIRVQDVRATQIDQVSIPSCFRPGDLVKAEVISLGTAQSYYLSTAKNELGVVYAESTAGVQMVPISWQEMQCPKTKVKEFRKVAKVET